MRDGTSTDRQEFTGHRNHNQKETEQQYTQRKNNDVDADEGIHERHEGYDKCHTRHRNKGEIFLISNQIVRLSQNKFSLSNYKY